MAEDKRVICTSAALEEGGAGVRFLVRENGKSLPAFVVRHAGVAHAYINRCAHVGVELDWQEGEFFDPDTGLLICATHGALYDPATGECRGGPCRGGRLTPVSVAECDGRILLIQEN